MIDFAHLKIPYFILVRTIIRYLAGACHTLLTLPVIGMLLKGIARLQAHDWVPGGAWLAAGIAGVYLWDFGGRRVLGFIRRMTEPAPVQTSHHAHEA